MYKRDCGMRVIDVQWRLVIRHYYIINETVQAKLINRKSVMKECKFNLFYHITLYVEIDLSLKKKTI